MIRAWERKFIEIFGKIFFQSDKNLVIFYKILQGLFYIPVTTFPILIEFLRNEFRELFPGNKQKFDRIFTYLTENYLKSDAKFKPSLWSSFTEISDFENFDNSTNFVESLNFVLKKMVPRGTVSFKKACETIFRFKIYEISQKHQAMKNGGMHRQGPETIRKRETILAIMKMLENVDLTDPKTLVNFALKYSHYNPSFTLY